MSVPTFDSNMFYRITNAALGDRVSLDVQNNPGGPTGALMISSTGGFTGQMWQFLSAPTTSENAFLLSCQFLGAFKKLDFQSGSDLTVPFLKPFNSTNDQTWIVSALADSTYTLTPSLLNGTQVLTAVNGTKQPFLSGPGGNEQTQEWFITPVKSINNPAFSLTALFPTSTKSSLTPTTIPSNSTPTPSNPTSEPLANTTAAAAAAAASPYTLHDATLAAIIVAPITLVAVLIILSIFLISWHRRTKQRRETLLFPDRKLTSSSSTQHLRIKPSPPAFPLPSPNHDPHPAFPHSPNHILSPYGHSPDHSFSSTSSTSAHGPTPGTIPRDATYRISIPGPPGLHVPPYQQSPVSRSPVSRSPNTNPNPTWPTLSPYPEYDVISPMEQGSPVELPGSYAVPLRAGGGQTAKQVTLQQSMARPLPVVKIEAGGKQKQTQTQTPTPTIVVQRSGSLISKWDV